MRDFRAFVRSQVAPLALPPDREQKIVDEWAAQIEDIYDALRARGPLTFSCRRLTRCGMSRGHGLPRPRAGFCESLRVGTGYG